MVRGRGEGGKNKNKSMVLKSSPLERI